MNMSPGSYSLINDAKGEFHEKDRGPDCRGAAADPARPGAGNCGTLGDSDGKGDRHRSLRQGRARKAGAGQCHKGNDASAGNGGNRLRPTLLRYDGDRLSSRLFHGRQPDLAERGRAADRERHDQGRVRRLSQ